MSLAERLSSKFHICPRSFASRPNDDFSFFGQSLSRGDYQPTYQPPERVYLLIINKISDDISGDDFRGRSKMASSKIENGEWGTGNGERGTGNGERGTGNGERGMGNGESLKGGISKRGNL